VKSEITKEFLEHVVKNSFSIAETLRKLNIKPIGQHYKKFHRWLLEWKIDMSHFGERGRHRNRTGLSNGNRKKTLEEILTENSYYNGTKLKFRLVESKIKEWKCDECDNTEWNGKKIPLELEHCNGISSDNRLENLKILCPNCHAQTEHYRGKNKKSCRNERRELKQRELNEVAKKEDLCTKGIKTLELVPKCVDCNGKISSDSFKRCVDCYKIYQMQRGKRPSYNELANDFKELKSFVRVGEKYNVSDNAVRKWAKLYQMEL
jgi:Zn finger protein HypA/HybF involved in hydrogenase expression